MDFADISSYQAGADLAAYARAGNDRILIKASQGTGYTNPFFAGWWQAAGLRGLARGAYHYATPSTGSTGRAEADHFARVVQAAGGLGPRDWVCLDIEDPKERGARAADHAAAFCRRMVELGYAGGVIYSGTWYLQPAGLEAGDLPERWRWLHLANYTRTADGDLPLPPGWAREQVLARQYSETAEQPGIPGKSDRNRVLREWLPQVARAVEEDDVRPSEWTDEDRRVVGQAVLDLLWAQMGDVGPTIKQGDVGDVIGQTYNKAGDLQSKVSGVITDLAAVRAAFAEVLGPGHPAAAALSAGPLVTVEDMVRLAPQVTPADAARVVTAFAPRLVPTPVTPTT